jgi:hypothetical protein
MISKENVPGPGAYSGKPQDKTGPAFSMRVKTNESIKGTTPGPGHVTVEQNWATDKPG